MENVSTIRQDNTDLLVCKCGDVSHQCYIGYNNGDNEAYLEVHLVRETNIFKRIAIAFKYVFGARSIYGDFDEIILSPYDAPKLQALVDHLNAHK
ncbi:hypothetical protein [uncultured Muribaculum sp.]|uniref:hypothetical protein n=1 Tax=uncultured Muribaculum sp. TaxID=1918613 RepID=UPI0025E610F9|nr:hypothetical protein [uncultured Muribaculum sp.]